MFPLPFAPTRKNDFCGLEPSGSKTSCSYGEMSLLMYRPNPIVTMLPAFLARWNEASAAWALSDMVTVMLLEDTDYRCQLSL